MGVVPLWTVTALVVAPFELDAVIESHTRGGRLATPGDQNGFGGEFSLEPRLVGTYSMERLLIQTVYGPRFFTRARGLGPERILVLHNANVLSRIVFSRRLRVEVNLSGADGQVGYSDADDLLGVDDTAAEVLPDQSFIEYTTGRAELTVVAEPARLWHLESTLSAVAFASEESSSPDRALQNQRRLIWDSTLERETDLDTTWGGELELAYRSFEGDPVFAGATAAGTLEERLGPATTVDAWLGGHGSLKSEGGVWGDELTVLPVGGIGAEHTFAVPPNRRLELSGRAELRPYHDPVLGTLDERVIVGLNLSLVMSSDFTVSAESNWSGLAYLLTDLQTGQTAHIVSVEGRFIYSRASSPFGAVAGIRYMTRLARRATGGFDDREELVAFLILTLSAELLGD